jgi:glycerol uptake facilitator-like aquaporin
MAGWKDPTRRFWRRTAAGAGWALLVSVGLLLIVAGWFTYELSGGLTGDLGPAVTYALLVAGVLGLRVVPVALLVGALCGAACAWVLAGRPDTG